LTYKGVLKIGFRKE